MLQKYIINKDNTIRHCIEVLDKTGKEIVLVCDKERRLLGTVTDGDVRRGILKGLALESPVEKIMHTTPVTALPEINLSGILHLMDEHVIHQLPIVDKNKRVVGIEFLEDLIPSRNLPNYAVIMAGGLGSRLYPLCQKTPKPMLKVGDKTILEIIIEKLKDCGITKICISVNYLGEKIQECFGDGSEYGVTIEYIKEKKKMGTAGALGLIPREKLTAPFLVMNGDILTNVNFKSMLNYHKQKLYEMTVALFEYTVQVPYGVISLNGNEEVREIKEKPTQRHLVNAGIYILNPSCLDNIPIDLSFDMPDLVKMVLSQKKKVGSFPIREYWIDIGHFEDYNKAKRDFEYHFNGNGK